MNDTVAREARPPRGISVIVPARNRADVIARQLDALAGQSTSQSFEVVVVDNGSTDATASVARSFAERFECLEVVEADRERGASYARNVGVAVASGELLAFCDSDDLVHAGWIEALATAWAPESLVAGRIQRLRLDADTHLPTLPDKPPQPRRPLRGFLPFADSANMAISRQDLDGVGGLDESFRFSADVELSWRGQLAGLQFVDAPDALVFKRPAPAGWVRFRQYHRWGRAACRLYGIYRPAGMPGRSARTVARSWAALGFHSLRGIWDPAERDIALRQAGWCSGYAAGSLRHRVVYL